MSRTIQVSASILCADFTKLKEEIHKCESAGVDMLHIDVMDGHFVPNITVGPILVEAIRPLTKLPIEAHLMIEHPQIYLENFINAGADIISIHAECYGSLKDRCREFGQYPKEIDFLRMEEILGDIRRIKSKGKKAFVVLNPGTDVSVTPLLRELDGLVVMSVNPGFAKQKFMPQVLPKIQKLRNEFSGDIVVDGGINEFTSAEAVKAGANILATASYFFSSEKPHDLVKNLKALKVS